MPMQRRGRLEQLAARWVDEAQTARTRYGDDRVAGVIEMLASELRQALDSERESLLTLREAAAVSGYSADHLGRMVRRGRLLNRGRKHSPRVRQGDLPVKPPCAPAAATRYLSEELFQDIMNSKHGER